RALFERAARDRAALHELERLADELVEEGYGLDDPLVVDDVLASSVALAALAPMPRHGEELLDLVLELEDVLRPGRASDAHLWLALARGVVAVQDVPRWRELAPEERCQHLRFALGGVERIAPEDGRDAYGVFLSEAAHDELAGAGRADEATELLERG